MKKKAALAIFPKSDRDLLIEQHVPLVKSIAAAIARRLPPCFDKEDLAGVGYIALIRAVETFDPARGTLVARIRFQVRCAMKDSVRRRQFEESTRISLDEPLKHQHTTGQWKTLRDRYNEGTGFAPVANPGGAENEHAREIDRRDRRAVVRGIIARMPERTARVMTICYEEERPILEAAAELGIHASRVSQLHHAGLRKLAAELTLAGIPVAYELLARAIARKAA